MEILKGHPKDVGTPREGTPRGHQRDTKGTLKGHPKDMGTPRNTNGDTQRMWGHPEDTEGTPKDMGTFRRH